MGLFGKLKDAVGIGSLKAEVQLTAPGFYPGDALAGNVILKEAASDTQVTSVLLQLVRLGTDVQITDVVTDDYWHGPQVESYEQQFKVNEVVYETFLAQNFTVAKGQRLELPFEIATPPDMLPSDNYNQWLLKAHADLPGKVDCRVTKPVKIMMDGNAPMMEPPPPVGGGLPAPGERILAYFDDAYYECTVNSVMPNGIHVAWDDGSDSVVGFDQVLPSESAIPGPADVAVGMRVMAKYELGFYECTVGAVQMNQVGIQWDDGSQTWVPMYDIRLL
jgi:hypothetical protein